MYLLTNFSSEMKTLMSLGDILAETSSIIDKYEICFNSFHSPCLVRDLHDQAPYFVLLELFPPAMKEKEENMWLEETVLIFHTILMHRTFLLLFTFNFIVSSFTEAKEIQVLSAQRCSCSAWSLFTFYVILAIYIVNHRYSHRKRSQLVYKISFWLHSTERISSDIIVGIEDIPIEGLLYVLEISPSIKFQWIYLNIDVLYG